MSKQLVSLHHRLSRHLDDCAFERIQQIDQDTVLEAKLKQDAQLRNRIDAMGWLARSFDMISPDLTSNMVQSFTAVYVLGSFQSSPEAKEAMRNKYKNALHGSMAVRNIMLILKQSNSDAN